MKSLRLATLLLVTVFAVDLPAGEKEQPKANIVLPPGFAPAQLAAIVDVLEGAAIDVSLAGLSEGPIVGADGSAVTADLTLGEDLEAIETIEALILIEPGDGAPAPLLEECRSLLGEAAKRRRFLGGLGRATALLARSGALRGRDAASAPGIEEDLRLGGAVPRDLPVVTALRTITARAEAAEPFARAVAEALLQRRKSLELAESLLAPAKELEESKEFAKAAAEYRAIAERHAEDGIVAAEALFALAFCHHTAKEMEVAADVFEELATEHPHSDQFGRAAFNAAWIRDKELEQPERAHRLYTMIIGGDCSDWDNTGDLMTPYQNYRFYALMGRGSIEARLARNADALQSFLDAGKHFATHCANCSDGAKSGQREEIASVLAALTGLEAEGLAERIDLKAERADECLFRLGNALVDASDADSARRIFRGLAQLFPKSVWLEKVPAGAERGGR